MHQPVSTLLLCVYNLDVCARDCFYVNAIAIANSSLYLSFSFYFTHACTNILCLHVRRLELLRPSLVLPPSGSFARFLSTGTYPPPDALPNPE